jgi:hypothetical protein
MFGQQAQAAGGVAAGAQAAVVAPIGIAQAVELDDDDDNLPLLADELEDEAKDAALRQEYEFALSSASENFSESGRNSSRQTF